MKMLCNIRYRTCKCWSLTSLVSRANMLRVEWILASPESLWTNFLMFFLTRNSIPSNSIKSFFTFRVMTVRIKQTMMHYSKYKPFKYDPTDSLTRLLTVFANCWAELSERPTFHIVFGAKKNNSKAQREERERRQFND